MNKKAKQAGTAESAERKSKWSLFHNNGIGILFSILAAVVAWFVISINNILPDTPTKIENVPIVIAPSEDAVSGKLNVFEQTEETADIYVKANSTVAKTLTADDFQVTAAFAPASGKTSGTGLQTATLTLRVTKKNNLADYEVDSVYPEEISVQYDRKKEISLKLTQKIDKSAAAGFYVDDIGLSEDTVTISGPESYINQVDEAVIAQSFSEPLNSTQEFTTPILLYGKDGKQIDYSNQHFTFSTQEVKVTVPVLAKKTVKLTPTLINSPASFRAESRLEISPATIDIVGTPEILSGINEVALSSPINFADITLENHKVTMDIPLPQGVKNISNVDKVDINVNLGGYKSKTVTTKTIILMNANTGQAEFVTQSLNVTVIGSEAQIAKLTGDSIQATVDLSGQKETTGNVELPAKISFVDSMDTCWAVGEYTVTMALGSGDSGVKANASSEAAVATPQE